METYLIIFASSSFVIGICKELSLGKLIRLYQLKKLHPEATLKDIENFEKNTKPKYTPWSSLKKKKST